MSSSAIILKSCDTIPLFLNVFNVISVADKQAYIILIGKFDLASIV